MEEPGKRKRRPSPAMLVALIALALSLGGVAYAIQANSVKSKHIKDGQVKPPDLNKKSKAGWVYVNGDTGDEFNGSQGVTSERLAEGIYFVRFPYSVRKRALVTGTQEPVAASVTVSRCGGASGDINSCSPDEDNNPKTLFVETFDSSASDADVDFWVAAIP